jgi:hypothetical protein
MCLISVLTLYNVNSFSGADIICNTMERATDVHLSLCSCRINTANDEK